jgi:hypothetical protein
MSSFIASAFKLHSCSMDGFDWAEIGCARTLAGYRERSAGKIVRFLVGVSSTIFPRMPEAQTISI